MKRIHENISEQAQEAAREWRERAEVLRGRAELLTGMDKLLMTMYLENGNSFRQMARLARVNEANISRRIRKLIKRLTEGEYIACLRNRDRFTAEQMSVARDYFLAGLSIRQVARRRRATYYRVRQVVDEVKAKVRGLRGLIIDD